MADRKIFVGMLAYDGKVDVQTHLALGASVVDFHNRGWDYKGMVRTGDSVVSRARNILVAAFLDSDATDFIMLDSDVTWPPGALVRMVDHPVDFVATMYRLKQDPEDYRFLHNARIKSDPQTNLVKMEHVPLGFLRLRRPVLEKMVEAHKDDWFAIEEEGGKPGWPLFAFEQHDHRSWGEDYVFCRNWRELGGTVWVDPDIPLGHTGNKTYYGNFGAWLVAIQGKQQPPALVLPPPAPEAAAFTP